VIEFSYHPHWPWLMAAGIAAAASLFWSYHRAIGRPKGIHKAGLLALRMLTILLVTVCLLDPQWVKRIEHQQPTRIAVLLDTSRSMSVQDMPENRLAAAQAWLREELMPVTPANASVACFAFDQSVTPLNSNALPSRLSFLNASPTGPATGLSDALEHLLTGSGSEPPVGIVLCSDGIETMNRDPVAVARLFRRKGIAIHTVTFGTTNEMRDLILENVHIKRAVPNQSATKIMVRIGSVGFGNVTLPLELRHGHELIAQTEVVLTEGSQQVELEFTPRVKGYQVFEAVLPTLPGEWLTHNNRRPFGLKVADPTIRVIYMEGSPTQARQPEWKYLKDALESDPQIEVKTLYRPQTQGSQSVNTVDSDFQTGEKIYHVQHPIQGFPRTLAELLKYDVVINSDIYKEAFTGDQLANTAKLVDEFGGGFVMIGGNTAFGSGGYHKTVLDRFIPVAMESSDDTIYSVFQMAIPPGALSHPLMALGETFADTKAIWTTKFPRLYGYNRVGRAKPGAVVLGVDPAASSSAGPRIILAAQEIGRGRTMAFASDTTRLWGRDFETIWGERIHSGQALSELNCDARYYRRFWINAIRWLAAGKVDESSSLVALELAHSVTRPGQAVPATVRVLDPRGAECADAHVQVVLSLPNRLVSAFPAVYDAATRLYHTQLSPPQTGDFTVLATATRGESQLGEDQHLLVCEDTDLEMEKVQARPDVMADIARVSGGEVIRPENHASHALTALFGNTPPVTVEWRRRSLWDKFWWLLAITGLVALEWIWRRLKGMA